MMVRKLLLSLFVVSLFSIFFTNSYAADDDTATLAIFYSNDLIGYLSPCG